MTVYHHLIALGFVCVVGSVVGSFLNVCIYRMPLGISVYWPPSRCPACHTPVALRDNIPIVGWILLGGRCRACATPISVRYAAVEALVAVLVGGVYGATVGLLRTDPSERGLIAFLLQLVPGMLMVSVVVVSVFITLDTRRFPARLASWGGLICGVLVMLLFWV
jgi:leader peptidase (prepilin peptidase)/N-methyltransferase